MARKKSEPTKKKASAKPGKPGKQQTGFEVAFTDIRLVDSAVRQSITGELPTHNNTHVRVIVGALNENTIVVRPQVVFTAWYEGKSKEDPAMLVDVTYQLMYSIKNLPEADVADRDSFFTQMGLLHSWPYFREYIQSQINRMGLPPILLPLLANPAQITPDGPTPAAVSMPVTKPPAQK